MTDSATVTDTAHAIERTLALKAPPERVWRALTDPAELCRWYPESTDLHMVPGSEGVMSWAEHGSFAVRVESARPLHYLAWRWAREPDTPVDAGQSTLVEWWLDERSDGGTTLRLRESGFVDATHRSENEDGWNGGLATLRTILEERGADGPSADLPAIERTLELDARPERVWRAISDADELSRWFPQRADWDLRPGGEGVFFWEGHGDSSIRVEAVDPPRYLAWRWGLEAESDPEAEESPTLVEWWLDPREDGGTTLRMRETGFRFPKHRAGNEEGWTEELGELHAFLAGLDPITEQ